MRRHSHRRVARHGLLGSLVGSALLTVAAGSAAAADPPAGCTTTADVTTCVFVHTGEAQTWTVPPTLRSATFDLYGAAGGGFADFDLFAPGLGGRATATLPVSAGDAIEINVGGQGTEGNFGSIPDGGGFNGGGRRLLGLRRRRRLRHPHRRHNARRPRARRRRRRRCQPGRFPPAGAWRAVAGAVLPACPAAMAACQRQRRWRRRNAVDRRHVRRG